MPLVPGTAVSPGPQSIGRALSGRAMALRAALPIKVSTTRRERFMIFPSLPDEANVADGEAIRQGERGDFTASCGISAPPREAEGVSKSAEAAAADAPGL